MDLKRIGAIVAAIMLTSSLPLLFSPAQAASSSPPAAVVDLFVQTGDSFVYLHWMPSWFRSDLDSNETEKYRIYRGVNSTNVTLLETLESTWFTDEGVVNGEIFYYQVRVFNELGEGPGITVEAAPRAAPVITSCSPTSVADCDPFDITLSWTPPDDTTSIVGYRIYLKSNQGINVDGNSTSITFSSGGGWGPYPIRISALYSDGVESFSRNISYINGPICEGGPCPFQDPLVLILLIASPAALVGLIVFAVLKYRKRT